MDQIWSSTCEKKKPHGKQAVGKSYQKSHRNRKERIEIQPDLVIDRQKHEEKAVKSSDHKFHQNEREREREQKTQRNGDANKLSITNSTKSRERERESAKKHEEMAVRRSNLSRIWPNRERKYLEEQAPIDVVWRKAKAASAPFFLQTEPDER